MRGRARTWGWQERKVALGVRTEVSVFRVCTESRERAEVTRGYGSRTGSEQVREGKSHVCLQHGSRVSREIKGAITLLPQEQVCREQASKGGGA